MSFRRFALPVLFSTSVFVSNPAYSWIYDGTGFVSMPKTHTVSDGETYKDINWDWRASEEGWERIRYYNYNLGTPGVTLDSEFPPVGVELKIPPIYVMEIEEKWDNYLEKEREWHKRIKEDARKNPWIYLGIIGH